MVSAPSGTGKTSLVHALLDGTDNLVASVSFTTRAPRAGEQHGRDYYFVSEDEFRSRIKTGDFFEHAVVFDKYYGTSRRMVTEQLQQGRDVVLEIDWQGARQIRAAMPDSCSIFILPPSRQVLEQRLRNRNQDSDEQIARRLRDAREEMSHYAEYDYVVFNDDFDTALQELQAIVRCGRLRCAAQAMRHHALLAELLAP